MGSSCRSAFVLAHEFALRHYMALNRFQQLIFRCAWREGSLNVDGIHFEEVPVCTTWGTWSTVTNLLEIIRALLATTPERLSLPDVFCQLSCVRGQIVNNPMNPRLRRRVRIIDDESESFGSRRQARPLKRRRDVCAVAGVLRGNHAVICEGTAANCECHITFAGLDVVVLRATTVIVVGIVACT